MYKSINIFVTLAILLLSGSVTAFTVAPVSNVQSSSSLQMTVLNYNGKKVNAKAGSPLKNVVGKLGVKPKYSCKKGDCGSCTISVGGNRVKACVGKVPPEPRLKSLQENGLVVK